MGPRKRRRYNAALFAPPTKETSSDEIEATTATSHWLLKGNCSTFDKIPNEILDKIFIYSRNIHFARASHIIGARLSSRYVYRAIFKAVFCYLSGPAIGGRRHEVASHDYTHVFAVTKNAPPLESQELVSSRNELLKCRWLDYDTWMDLIEEIVTAEKTRLKTCFSSESEYHSHCEKGFQLELGKQCFIPGKLLGWPQRPDTMNFLRELFDRGARIDWISTLDGETARASRRKAVEAGQVEAFMAFAQVTSGSTSDVDCVCDLFRYGSRSFFDLAIEGLQDELGCNIDWSLRSLWQAADARLNARNLSNSYWPLDVLRRRAHDDIEPTTRRR